MCIKKISWPVIEKILRVIEIVAVVVAVIIIPVQIKELGNAQMNRSLDLLFRLEDRIRYEKNLDIFYSIDGNKNLLIKNKGEFTEPEIDRWLDDLASIQDVYERHLITFDDAYYWFSDYLIGTCDNQEIKQYISDLRQKNQDYYSGFEDFCKKMESYGK